MINVLYAVIRGEMGGVERFLDSVLSAHSDRVRPVVLSFRDGPWLDELRARGVPVYVIENARLREPMRCFREVRAIIRRHQIDVVHSSYSWCHSLTGPAAFYSGCRTVWFHHGPLGEGRWQGAMALIPADLMLTNSDFMLERLKTTIHSARRLGVVHYGVEAIAWSEIYAKYEAIIMGDEPVVARGKLDVDDERAQIILEGLTPLDSALLDSIREVRITAPMSRLENGGLDALKTTLARYHGKSMTYLHVNFADGREAVMLLGDPYRVTPTNSFITELEQILPPGSVELR